MKVMFLREAEGIYRFGHKRVAIRVENNKIVVRVGGGYLSIDEFIDQYKPTELSRIERSRDPIIRSVCESIGR